MKNIAALQKENDLLRAELAIEKEKNSQRDVHILSLNEQIKLLLQKRYGTSSEKTSQDQLGLFNEAEDIVSEEPDAPESESTLVKSHTRKSKPRVTIPDHLPREEVIHDLPESEKVCPHDGTPLEHIGSDDHEQLEIIPVKIKVIRHKRLKCTCPCCDKHIVTAKKPPSNRLKRVSLVPVCSPILPYRNTMMPYRCTAKVPCSNVLVLS